MSTDISYDRHIRRSRSFRNATSERFLSSILSVSNRQRPNQPLAPFSFFPSFNSLNMNRTEFASSLRRSQSHDLSMKSVVKGVSLCRAGRNAEAMQLLNKALHVEADNTEALVARGALYANMHSYDMAIQDWEDVLKIDSNNRNAQKYLTETLLIRAKAYEHSTDGSPRRNANRAVRMYARVLQLVPDNEQARNRMERLDSARQMKSSNVKAAVGKRHRSNSSTSSDQSIVELAPTSSTSSTGIKEKVAKTDRSEHETDMKRKLLQYYLKTNPQVSLAETEQKLADPAFIDRLKHYYLACGNILVKNENQNYRNGNTVVVDKTEKEKNNLESGPDKDKETERRVYKEKIAQMEDFIANLRKKSK